MFLVFFNNKLIIYQTKIITAFTRYFYEWKRKTVGKRLENDLKNAGIEISLVDSAVAELLSYLIKNRGYNVPRQCVKDSDIFVYMEFLHYIFPKSKFIYMVRDGRAAAYSLMVHLKEEMLPSVFSTYFDTWNSFNRLVNKLCIKIGPNYCLRVKYENLILHSEKTLREIIQFLNESWSDEMLKNLNHIGSNISNSEKNNL